MASRRRAGTQQRKAGRRRGKFSGSELHDTSLIEVIHPGRFGQLVEGRCYTMHAELEPGIGL